MSIYAKLAKVQAELKAPKNQFNNFGKYNYRSCEDILEAVKPLCIKHGLVLNLSDKIINEISRFYIVAYAVVYDIESGEACECTGYAREEETKKGMDASQITGSASSYARKYALNGLFCIDDTKDADATNEHGKSEVKDEKPWYNDFESHKEAMFEGIKSGEKTAQSIIKNLEARYKVSKEIKTKIEGLK